MVTKGLPPAEFMPVASFSKSSRDENHALSNFRQLSRPHSPVARSSFAYARRCSTLAYFFTVFQRRFFLGSDLFSSTGTPASETPTGMTFGVLGLRWGSRDFGAHVSGMGWGEIRTATHTGRKERRTTCRLRPHSSFPEEANIKSGQSILAVLALTSCPRPPPSPSHPFQPPGPGNSRWRRFSWTRAKARWPWRKKGA